MPRKSATPAPRLAAPSTRRRLPPSAFGRLTDELIVRIFRAVEALGTPFNHREPYASQETALHLHDTRRSLLTRLNRRWYKVCTPLLWKSITLKRDKTDPQWIASVLDKFKPKIKDFTIWFDEDPTEQDVKWIRDVFGSAKKILMTSFFFRFDIDQWGTAGFSQACDIVRYAGNEVKHLVFQLEYWGCDPAEGYEYISDMLDFTPQLRELLVSVNYTVARGSEPLYEEYHGYHHKNLVCKAKARRPKLRRISIDGLEAWMEGGGSEHYDNMGNWC